MKKCPKCGAQMSSDTNFCTECGADLRNVSVSNESAQSTETFEPNGTVENQNQQQANQNTQQTAQAQATQQTQQAQQPAQAQPVRRSIDTEQAKQTAASYWKWLLGSWAHPTNTEAPTSKWFGVVSIAIEIFLFCASFFTMVQKAVAYLNQQANNVSNGLAALLGQQQNNSNLIHFNSFGTSFEIFIVLLLLDASVLGAVYGINCWVFREKESFFDFINRFAHYTNVILITNLLFFLFSLMSAYTMMALVLVLSIFLYILGMTMVIVTRQGSQRLDRLYGAVFVAIIILIALGILCAICGTAVDIAVKSLTGGLGN